MNFCKFSGYRNAGFRSVFFELLKKFQYAVRGLVENDRVCRRGDFFYSGLPTFFMREKAEKKKLIYIHTGNRERGGERRSPGNRFPFRLGKFLAYKCDEPCAGIGNTWRACVCYVCHMLPFLQTRDY